jgi:CheY-like chemotaxis protein
MTAPIIKNRILVIEDDFDTAEMLQLFLEIRGYDVHGVTSRDDALEYLAGHRIDTLMMDLFMPGMSAEVFLPKIQALGCSNIVLYTAAPDPSHEAKRLRLKTVLRKPLTEEAVMEALSDTALLA